MRFEEDTTGSRLVLGAGYLLSYTIFTTIFYAIFTLTHEEAIPWWSVALGTAGVVVLARLVRWWMR